MPTPDGHHDLHTTPGGALVRHVADAPDTPGVYRFDDADGAALYVGKATSLARRLREHTSGGGHTPQTASLPSRAATVTWVVCATGHEALLLENEMISQLRPPLNSRGVDDTSAPTVAVTVDDVPRLRRSRARRAAHADPRRERHLGPFSTPRAADDALAALQRVFKVRSCTDATYQHHQRLGRPCLLGQIDKCAAPCTGADTPEDHQRRAAQLLRFADGDHRPVLDELRARMDAAAADHRYEVAARTRDQLHAAEQLASTQRVIARSDVNADAVAVHSDGLTAAVAVHRLRRGRLVGTHTHVIELGDHNDTGHALTEFLVRYASDRGADLPAELLVDQPPSDPHTAAAARARRGGPVAVRVPRRADKRAAVDLAADNARAALHRHKLTRSRDPDWRRAALADLAHHLDLAAPPWRIEAFDVSTLHGHHTTAAMVVLHDGQPARSQYRRFTVRGRAAHDDPAAVRHAVARRLRRHADEADLPATQRRFTPLPGLLLVDGGCTQARAAAEAASDAGVDVAVAGLAKRLEELHLPTGEVLRLPRTSDALRVLQHARDEAHRFALQHHRTRRGRAAAASYLDTIPGVGPTLRTRLLHQFGSVDALRRADVDDLTAVTGVGQRRAAAILDALTAE